MQSVCVGTVAQFSDQSVTAPGNPAIHWAWDFGDGATDTVQAPTHPLRRRGQLPGDVERDHPVLWQHRNTKQVIVEAKPTAAFTSTPVLGCSPMNVSFTNTSSGAVNYVWAFGDGGGDNAANTSHTYINNGTIDSVYTVSPIASTAFGCGDTATMPSPWPHWWSRCSRTMRYRLCALDVDFSNNSTGAASYQWTFGDGATSTAVAPSHQYTNTTLFLQTNIVTLVAVSAAGCTDTAQQSIMVYPAADLRSWRTPDSGCSPFTHHIAAGARCGELPVGFRGRQQRVRRFTDTRTSTPRATVRSSVITFGRLNAFGCSDTFVGQR